MNYHPDTISDWIPLENCRNRGVYRIDSRNLTIGVFDEIHQSFIGIREKFGSRYLFAEYHWDTGAPFGTVRPQEMLTELPDGIELREREETVCGWGGCGMQAFFVKGKDDSEFGYWAHKGDKSPLCKTGAPLSATYQPLFNYLEEIEANLRPMRSNKY